MSELSELIKINKNIEKQNEEIIRLLKKKKNSRRGRGFYSLCQSCRNSKGSRRGTLR